MDLDPHRDPSLESLAPGASDRAEQLPPLGRGGGRLVRLRLIGAVDPETVGLFSRAPLDTLSRFEGYRPHGESVQALLDSHLLLLIIEQEPRAKGIVSGKLFEYLGSETPILALAPQGEAAEILRRTGGARVVPPMTPPESNARCTRRLRCMEAGPHPLRPEKRGGDPILLPAGSRRATAANLRRNPLSKPRRALETAGLSFASGRGGGLRCKFRSLTSRHSIPGIHRKLTKPWPRWSSRAHSSVAHRSLISRRSSPTILWARHALGVSSGTSALHLALIGAGVEPGQEVVVPAHTFTATAEVVRRLGARVRFCEINRETFTCDASHVEASLTPSVKAVIPVALYGHPADCDPIIELARSRGIQVIEDAAQAHGARYRGRRCGVLAPFGTFSFYPGKNLGAFGDGGMVICEDGEICARLRSLADHGRLDKYSDAEEGFNYRLDSLQAAVLRVRPAPFLDKWNEQRRRAASLYEERLASIPGVKTPHAAPWAEHVFHVYVIRIPGRDAVLARLREEGIEAGIHYPLPLHLQPAYRSLGYARGTSRSPRRSRKRSSPFRSFRRSQSSRSISCAPSFARPSRESIEDLHPGPSAAGMIGKVEKPAVRSLLRLEAPPRQSGSRRGGLFPRPKTPAGR